MDSNSTKANFFNFNNVITSNKIFAISIFIIILLSIVVRFVNYGNRWGIAYDQSRDALVARQVLHGDPMPILGPFSSAGNFTTGPIWYWFVTAATSVYPNSVLTPWIILTLTYVLVVILMISLGTMIGGRSLGILLGFITAVSPAQIAQGLNLTNPSLVAVLAAFVLWSGVSLFKTKKLIYAALLGFTFGGAITAHYQSFLLGIFVAGILLFSRLNLKKILVFIIFFLLPFIPLFQFDVTNNWYNTRGILDYLQYGQYNIYVPNRWLTYIGEFIPELWSKVVGGNVIVGRLFFVLLGIALGISIYKKTLSKLYLGIFLSFLIMIVFLRYYRGERFEAYFVFLHPFLLLISAWSMWILIKYKYTKVLGIIIFTLLLVSNMFFLHTSITNAENFTAIRARYWIQLLETRYPNKTFSIWDNNDRSRGVNYPLVLYLEKEGKLSSDGYKIGIGTPDYSEQIWHTRINENNMGFDLWDLNSSTSAKLKEASWSAINTNDVYNEITRWYLKN